MIPRVIEKQEFDYAARGYLAQCEGVMPPKGIYSHISGIDLLQGKDKQWYILEDNLRIPSGASYPMIARDLCRKHRNDMMRHILSIRSLLSRRERTGKRRGRR